MKPVVFSACVGWLAALTPLIHAAPPPAAFESFCFKCHDATQTEGDLDLEAFVSQPPGAEHAVTLEDIILRIEEGDMPPKKSRKQPTALERAEMNAWARRQIDSLAEASMDDPGAVAMARLTRPEYRNVIRDLSGGIVPNAGEYLPNEGGAGEGFSNVGEAQGMGVAQFEKYLEAAKGTLRHLRVSPHDGLIWSTVAREPADDQKSQIKEGVDDVIGWYIAQQQKWGREHRDDLQQKFGFSDAAYLEAAWRYRWRAEQGQANATFARIAHGYEVPLAPVVLEKWFAILSAAEPREPFVAWATAWQALGGQTKDVRARCNEIVSGKGAHDRQSGPAAPPYEVSFHEAITEVVGSATERGVWPFRLAIGDAKELFFVVTDAGDGAQGEFAVWRAGRFQMSDGTARPWQEVSKVTGANSGRGFPFGKDYNGRALPPDSIGVKPPGALRVSVPPGAVTFELELALAPQSVGRSSVQAIVLKEKPKSQSYIPGRMVFGGKPSGARDAKTDQQAKELQKALRKRNVAEANLTKIGLSAERNVLAGWTRTPLEVLGGPWPEHVADKEEPLAPYHLTVAQARRNAREQDRALLLTLEDRLFALAQPLPDETLEARVREWLNVFATRAWRRPLAGGEKENLMQLYRDSAKPGVSFDSAMKVPLMTVLMSPNFIYRRASELPSRLSFFLWASIPDAELLSEDLSNPEVLKTQTARMLRDPRAAALAEVFGAQVWHFEGFENHTGPDEKRFPDFTAERRQEMLHDVHATLNHVFLKDAPLSRLLDEDCLATKPLFLTQTSLPLRTSPVQRGAWVVETLIGRRIPPPPPNVPQISADEKSAAGLNIQQQLAKHRSEANCAACHAKIDPPGIALENFDPIGRWRDTQRDGSPIVNSDKLTDGSEIKGVEGLKAWLKSREPEFRANFNRKLLGYALGRAVLPGDKHLLERMADQGTFSATVQTIVSSPQFTRLRTSP
ncbi:DUF1588 domain-containing protein [Prosthecobacter sp.]|uniref:DUF1588 domain-containing protein n=1 Tax=Prosthecobacter sp. TaxID=1965333 RepID=UPI0037835DCA